MSGKEMQRLFTFSFCLVTMTGCAAQRLYDWGSYDPAIAAFYDSESEGQGERHIEALGTEIERTRPERIPPGKAAHLGFLYQLKGDTAAAREFFLLEKRLFPESQTLIDNLTKARP